MREREEPLPLSGMERQKYEAACRLGLTEKLLRVGWGGLTAEETGRIGGLIGGVARRKRRAGDPF